MKNIKENKKLAFFLRFTIPFIGIFALLFYIKQEFPGCYSIKSALGAAAAIALLMAVLTNKKAREFAGIEHGSARYGTSEDIKPFIDRKNFYNNIIFSQTEMLSMNDRATHRNLHVMVTGGAGSGKSRNYAKVNIMQMNGCYVITDPSGEHFRDTAKMLRDNGFTITVFNTVDFGKSLKFNPLHYFQEAKDVRKFINVFMANTSGDTSNPNYNEDFWVKAERLWLMAHIAYIMETCSDEEKNLNSVVLLLNNSEARDDDEDFKSPVDILFDDLERQNSESFAVKQYKKYKLAAGKTAKSILVSVGVRMADFDIPEIADLVSEDELHLEDIGMKKTALYLIMDETDPTYNYLVAILLDILISTFKRTGSLQPGGRLPLHVRCILDEIANIGRFPHLYTWAATMRKYNVGFEFLFQNINQMKAQYKDHWATIEGNCDSTVFMGGKGEDTTKYVSDDMLGKATIDTVSYGSNGSSHSIGKSNYSSNEQKTGRSLLDRNEVTLLNDEDCIVKIRGLQPFKSKKFIPEKHPNYRFLADADPHNAFTFEMLKEDEFDTRLDTSRVNYHYITEINLQEVS